MLMLNVRDFSSKINSVRSLDGMSFTREGGEILTLLGPSVSGKTTILRAIGGDESLDSGRAMSRDARSVRTYNK